nr:alpha-1,3-mannosyl-glycoprotein 2-beta-N-acetylglucosaminyltransferase-like [Crassostrea gigas]
MRRKHLVGVVVVIFLTWNVLMYYMLVSRNPGKYKNRSMAAYLWKVGAVSVQDQLRNLQGDIQRQLSHNSDLLQQLRKFREQKQSEKLDKEIHRTPRPIDTNSVVLPILLIACDRTTVSRSLDLLLNVWPC